MKNNKEKSYQYAAMIQEAIAELISEHELLADFDDENNATAFLHALANVVSCNIYKKLTNDNTDILGFNHIANRLVYQFTKQDEAEA
jgi:hypothetical protein